MYWHDADGRSAWEEAKQLSASFGYQGAVGAATTGNALKAVRERGGGRLGGLPRAGERRIHVHRYERSLRV